MIHPLLPGVVKVGIVAPGRERQRLSQANTHCPHRLWRYAFLLFAEDRLGAEKGIHRILAPLRVGEGEFFRGTPEELALLVGQSEGL